MSVQIARRNPTLLHASVALARILLAGLFVLVLVPAVPARADTSVCGPITVDTTWTAAGNNYIVTCDVIVNVGARLVIESGVVVKFEPGTSLFVAGELIAHAATFTSNVSTPAKGDWGHIFFAVTSEDAVFDGGGAYVSGCIIQESVIEWGGGGSGVRGQLEVDGASPFLDRNTIRYSSLRGIHAVGRSSGNRIVVRESSVSDNSGGGIDVTSGHLEGNTITDNSSTGGGGGIYAVDSYLENNQVNHNSAGGYGGGIHASGSDLIGNTISGNSAIGGGGINASGGSITNNTVTGNSAVRCYGDGSVPGGGIYASGGSIVGNTVSGNSSTAASGLYCLTTHGIGGGIYASLSTVTGNTVSNNATTGVQNAYGGGVYGAGSTISGNTITGNTANAGPDYTVYGGGIYADGGAVMDNAINSNTAAGGTDSQGGGVYGSVNTLNNNTLSGNSARRGGAIYSNMGTVTNNTVTNNTTSWTGSIYLYEGTALGNILEGNSAINGGGLAGIGAVLTGNIVQNNTANLGGGILSSEGTVRGNTVTGNAAQSDGGGIYAEGGTVTENMVTANTVPSFGHGAGVYLLGVVDFMYNSITDNTASGGTAGGISVDGQSQVQYNNLHGNQPYDAEVLSADPVTGTHNYWGESLCTAIPWQIYDGNDLPGRGKLSYAPSLYSPVPVAQLDAPTDLLIDLDEDAVTLSWTPIDPIPDHGCQPPGYTGPDQGYSIYYSIGEPCGPFDGTGLPAGDSPINIGDVTSYKLNGLGPGDYYFVVAAHDYLGRESAFTNSVNRLPYRIYLPVVLRSA